MERKRTVLVFAVVSTFCILLAVGPAFAMTIPAKLKDIPLYKGSAVQQTMDMTNHAMLIASVKAKVDDIADFYRTTMVGKGWKAAFQAQQEDMETIQFRKDKRIFQVTIQYEKGGDTTTYTLVMTSE